MKKVVTIERHLEKISRLKPNGQWNVGYYARFRSWNHRYFEKRLSSDLQTARRLLKRYELLNDEKKWPLVFPEELAEAERQRQEQQRANAMTVAKFAAIYKELPEIKAKRSADRDAQHLAHICRIKGDRLLSELTRSDFTEYRDQRRTEKVFRGKKQTKIPIKDGTIRNELSCWRHMLNIAVREKDDLGRRGIVYEVSTVSFDGIMPDGANRERVLSDSERPKLLKESPRWLRRLLIVALESCLSRSDLLRLRWSNIDEATGVIIPEGGRKKTGTRQVSPLTAAAREVFDDIRRERRRSKIALMKTADLVFLREDGSEITGNMITKELPKACKRAGLTERFTFHDCRHTAKTDWARRGVPVEAAMLGAGHASVEMHRRYIHLSRSDVAKAFGTAPVVVQDAVRRKKSK